MARVEDFQAKDLMSKDYISAKPEDSVSHAIGMIRQNNVGEIPIQKGGTIVGIISEDTFIKRRHLPLSTKLEHIMSTPPKVKPDDSVVDVSELLLSSGYRGVPVISEKEEILGFISRTDVINKIPEMEEFKNTLVEEVMTPSPSTVKEHEKIGKARAMMEKMDEKVIPVVDKHGQLSGMIGIKDILNKTSGPRHRRQAHNEGGGKFHQAGEKNSPYEDIEIWSIMNSPAITCPLNDNLHNAANKMIENDISTVVIEEEDGIKGILTQIDLIELIASFREEEQVYVQITGLEEDPDVYDMMYENIQKYLQKISKVAKPLVLNVHVVTHKEEGHEKKYSIRLRLNTDHGMYYAKKFDWNIMRALDEGMDSLKRNIFDEIEKNRDIHRKHPKYRER